MLAGSLESMYFFIRKNITRMNQKNPSLFIAKVGRRFILRWVEGGGLGDHKIFWSNGGVIVVTNRVLKREYRQLSAKFLETANEVWKGS